MWVGTAVTGAFAGATLVSYLVHRSEASEAGVALNCGVGLGQVLCSGSF
jgi:hypothetical protein